MSEGRTKKAAMNVAFNFLNQILTLSLSFVSRTVFVWGLGAEYLGINGLFSDVLGLLSMADLGFGTAMVYSFYKPLADNDYRKIAGLTTFYKKVYTIIAVVVSIVGVALIPFLPYLINLEKDIPHLTLYYLLSLANVVFSYLCVYRTSILSADQKSFKITRITMIVNIIRSILQIMGIAIWKSYTLYLVLGCISVLINNLIASYVAVKEYPFIKNSVELKADERKNIFANIGSVFLYKVSSVLLNTTDNMLISVIVGTIAVGYYSNYLMLQNKISMFYTLLFTSLTASIGNLIVNEKAERRYEIFCCEQSVSFIACGFVIPCYILLVNDLMSIWLGDDFVLDNLVVVAIGLNMYLSCVLQPLWSYREATGLYRKTKWIMIMCAVLNLVLSIILGKIVGLAGILFASGLSRLLTYVWYEPRLLFKEYFELSPKKYYIQLSLNAILIIFLVIGIGFLSSFIQVNSVLSWFVKACFVGITSLTIVLMIYSKTEGFRILRLKIEMYLKNRKRQF